MDRYKDIFSVVMEDNKWDFRVRVTVTELSLLEMDKLRAMIIAASGTMEDMWRRKQKNAQQAASGDGLSHAVLEGEEYTIEFFNQDTVRLIRRT